MNVLRKDEATMELLPELGTSLLLLHVSLHYQLPVPHGTHRDVATLGKVLHVHNNLAK